MIMKLLITFIEKLLYQTKTSKTKKEKITLNKYGRMRLKYLKEHKKTDYTIMLMNVTLNTHLKKNTRNGR